MKAAIIAAVVAALVSGASATAAFVVTSKNIRTARSNWSTSARTRRRRCADSGAARAARHSGRDRGYDSPMFVPPGFPNASVEATCPDGEQPISGGFQATGVPTVPTSAPNLARRSWVVIGNSVQVPATLTAVAYCAPNVTIHPPWAVAV
jgi:hypothetical protein